MLSDQISAVIIYANLAILIFVNFVVSVTTLI